MLDLVDKKLLILGQTFKVRRQSTTHVLIWTGSVAKKIPLGDLREPIEGEVDCACVYKGSREYLADLENTTFGGFPIS